MLVSQWLCHKDDISSQYSSKGGIDERVTKILSDICNLSFKHHRKSRIRKKRYFGFIHTDGFFIEHNGILGISF